MGRISLDSSDMVDVKRLVVSGVGAICMMLIIRSHISEPIDEGKGGTS